MSSRHTANESFRASTDKSAEALAAAAEASKLAKKVRDRSTEQAIDKPTQTFGRRRNNSNSPAAEEKFRADRHDLVGENQSLLQLTLAAGGTSNVTTSCQSQDAGESELDDAKPLSNPKSSFTLEVKNSKPLYTDTWDYSFRSEPLFRESKQNSTMRPVLQPADSSVSTTASPKSLVALQNPGRFYRMMQPICGYMETVNILSSKKAWRLFEWCDFSWTPEIIRYTCQDILTSEWIHQAHVPFLHGQLQPAPPAHIAASRLETVIREVYNLDMRRDLEVFEFCAGSSGPTPTFERLINTHRMSRREKPIRFRISDKYPNLQAWKKLRTSSDWLDFVKSPVDAVDPSYVAVSRGNHTDIKGPVAAESNNENQGKRIFRLFNCSFHHFGDRAAVQILKSTMETSDGFAIIELQDRRLGMLCMMALNFLFVCRLVPSPNKLCGPFKSSNYGIFRLIGGILLWVAILFVLQFDGFVSCLRTREFDEFVQLIQQAAGTEGAMSECMRNGEHLQICTLPSWEIRAHEQVLHTLPFGYVRMITGVRTRFS